jgi:hypothetical protein
MIARRILRILLLVATSAPLNAQEIRYIDLTVVQQRTELRYPPAPPAQCEKGESCVVGRSVGGSIGDGAPDRRDPHALGIYLLRVNPTDINPAKSFEAEFRVVNTGLAPIDIPVSPHLSDLQPGDASLAFSYFSLALVAKVASEPERPDVYSLGFVELYGAPDHDGTIIVLKPGEWIRVKANVKLMSPPPEPGSARSHAEFWLRKNTFHPHPGGSFTETQNLYPNVTPADPATWLPVHLLRPAVPANAKQ